MFRENETRLTGNREVSTLVPVETHLVEVGWGMKAGTKLVGRVDFQSKTAIVNKNFSENSSNPAKKV